MKTDEFLAYPEHKPTENLVYMCWCDLTHKAPYPLRWANACWAQLDGSVCKSVVTHYHPDRLPDAPPEPEKVYGEGYYVAACNGPDELWHKADDGAWKGFYSCGTTEAYFLEFFTITSGPYTMAEVVERLAVNLGHVAAQQAEIKMVRERWDGEPSAFAALQERTRQCSELATELEAARADVERLETNLRAESTRANNCEESRNRAITASKELRTKLSYAEERRDEMARELDKAKAATADILASGDRFFDIESGLRDDEACSMLFAVMDKHREAPNA